MTEELTTWVQHAVRDERAADDGKRAYSAIEVAGHGRQAPGRGSGGNQATGFGQGHGFTGQG